MVLTTVVCLRRNLYVNFFDPGNKFRNETYRAKHKNGVRQQTVFAKKSVSDIFPEYYIIKVNDFNDIAKNCLDEWIYFLKNSEVKDEFNAQGLKEAGTILDIMRLNEEEQYGYNRYMEYISYKASEMLSLRLEAEFVVSEERMRNTIEIAKKLLLNGVDESLIAASTGLSVSEIEALRDGLE